MLKYPLTGSCAGEIVGGVVRDRDHIGHEIKNREFLLLFFFFGGVFVGDSRRQFRTGNSRKRASKPKIHFIPTQMYATRIIIIRAYFSTAPHEYKHRTVISSH